MNQQTVSHHLLLKLGVTVKVAPFLRLQQIRIIRLIRRKNNN